MLTLPPNIVTQIWSHIAGPPLPPPHYGTCLLFHREKKSAFSSLVDSLRIVPTPAARRSQKLIPLFVFCIFAHKFKLPPRWESNSRTNALMVSKGVH